MLNHSVLGEQEGKEYNKYQKYSLRHRHRMAFISKLDRYRPFDNQLESIQPTFDQSSRTPISQEQAGKDFSTLSSTNSELSSFNCIKNGQSVIEFNKKNSVSVFYKQKVQRRTQQIGNSNHKMEQARFLFHKKQNANLQLITSDSYYNSSIPSQKYSINSHSKFKDSTTFLKNSQNDRINFKKSQSKFSLRKSNPLTSGRSEFRICLRYADIKTPLRILSQVEQVQMRQMRQLVNHNEKSSKIGKIFCNSFKNSKTQGCFCEPKCLWLNRWLAQVSQVGFTMQKQEIKEEHWAATLLQIEKDLPRTQINAKTFRSQSYIQHLREVLITYAKMDWSVGYVQGMNIIVSVLVYHSSSSYDSFRVLSCLMIQKGLRKVFVSDLSFGKIIALALSSQLKRLSYDLYSHLTSQQVDIQMFVVSWYFSLLGSFVPLESMHLVIDKYMRRGWSGINQVIIALLLLLRQELMIREEQELMECLSNRYLEQRSILVDWNELILSSDNLLLPKIKF